MFPYHCLYIMLWYTLTRYALNVQNGLAYPCFCSSRRLDLLRRDAVRRGEAPRYDNKCRHISQSDAQARIDAGVPHTIRFKVWKCATYRSPLILWLSQQNNGQSWNKNAVDFSVIFLWSIASQSWWDSLKWNWSECWELNLNYCWLLWLSLFLWWTKMFSSCHVLRGLSVPLSSVGIDLAWRQVGWGPCVQLSNTLVSC